MDRYHLLVFDSPEQPGQRDGQDSVRTTSRLESAGQYQSLMDCRQRCGACSAKDWVVGAEDSPQFSKAGLSARSRGSSTGTYNEGTQ